MIRYEQVETVALQEKLSEIGVSSKIVDDFTIDIELERTTDEIVNLVKIYTFDKSPVIDKFTKYQESVNSLIREKYSIETELGLTNDCNLALIAGESVPVAYIAYREYVNQCKDSAHIEIFGIPRTT